MKRTLNLRLPFSLLVLIAVFAVLTCRVAVRRGLVGGPLRDAPFLGAPLNETETLLRDAPFLGAPFNETETETLLRLAAVDNGEAELSKDVDVLLDGNLPTSTSASAALRHRSASFRGRENHYHPLARARERYTMRPPIRLRTPKDYPIFPEFRRALRDWFRGRRYQSGVMSELADLVKGPIDRHRGDPDTGGGRYPSCAVVGNSGILLQREHGALIDGHEMVIRLNNARVEGYQRFVGSKTGLSFVNSNILRLCARREGCFCHPYGEDVPIIMYICQAVHFLDYTLCNASHKAPLLITDPRFDLLCARIVKYYSLKRFVEETGKSPEDWSKAHDERAFHYSSGMQAIMLALGICDQVSVFGFGKTTDAKHHYHTNQKVELDLHDYVAEYAFYHDLVEQPQVIPFLNDSEFKVPPIVFYH